jgi:hypothetical protein
MNAFGSPARRVHRSLAATLCATALAGVLAAGAAPSIAAVRPATQSAGRPHVGTYKTWPAAQRAARFRLLRPAVTYDLKIQMGGIRVSGCAGADTANVVAQYGRASGRDIVLFQDDARGAQPCENPGEGSTLGSYKVDGTTAILYGACGIPGSPSCSAPHQYYWLVWTRHGRYYQVFTHDLTRWQNVRVARRLHKVS